MVHVYLKFPGNYWLNMLWHFGIQSLKNTNIILSLPFIILCVMDRPNLLQIKTVYFVLLFCQANTRA
jgi:hypothetical protein